MSQYKFVTKEEIGVSLHTEPPKDVHALYHVAERLLKERDLYHEVAVQLVNRNLIGLRTEQGEVCKDYSDEARSLIDREVQRLLSQPDNGVKG